MTSDPLVPPVPPLVQEHEARIAARRETAGSLVRLTLELPASVRASHALPGQYVSVWAGGDTGYFVLASAVGADTWEILLRAGGTVADALLVARVGERVPVTAALGSGFPCVEARGRALVVAVAGTGMAAAMPILAWRMSDGDAARTDVFLGMRVAAELPLTDEIASWRAAGARVTVCLSREDPPRNADPSGAVFVRGYVQDVARASSTTARVVFAVGPGPMVDAVRKLAGELGVEESDFRTNY